LKDKAVQPSLKFLNTFDRIVHLENQQQIQKVELDKVFKDFQEEFLKLIY
jgi:hypothetical protein